MTLVAAGTVSDYGASEVSNLRSAFASAAGVDVGAVSVSITAASVLITATIGVASASAVTSVTSNLATALPDASTASSLLGITVNRRRPSRRSSLEGAPPASSGYSRLGATLRSLPCRLCVRLQHDDL